jgi:hypothetical protein
MTNSAIYGGEKAKNLKALAKSFAIFSAKATTFSSFTSSLKAGVSHNYYVYN